MDEQNHSDELTTWNPESAAREIAAKLSHGELAAMVAAMIGRLYVDPDTGEWDEDLEWDASVSEDLAAKLHVAILVVAPPQ